MAATNDQRRAAQATPTREEYNASDPRMVAERAAQSKLREHLEAQGLAHVLATAEGRAWLYKLLDACGVFRSSFTGNSETFMREGMRNVGLIVLADVMKDHDEAYLIMVREAKDRGTRGFRPRQFAEEKDNV